MKLNDLAHAIIGAAMNVHQSLGPRAAGIGLTTNGNLSSLRFSAFSAVH